MVLLLARLLVELGDYALDRALQAHQFWLDSRPFDCRMTAAAGLQGGPNPDSQNQSVTV